MATIEDAALIASELPGVTEGERHGNSTWFAAGKAFAWERPFGKADLKRYRAHQRRLARRRGSCRCWTCSVKRSTD